MKQPIFVINCKAYEEAIGINAVKLALACETVSIERGIEVLLAVQPSDVFLVASQTSIRVLSQHADPCYGAFTGRVSLKSLKDACAWGVMINHSERRVDVEEVKKVVEEGKKLDLKALVCVSSLEEARLFAPLKPWGIAFEIPQLIGGEKSITEAAPEEVRSFAAICENHDVLSFCGAGITKSSDVKKAIEMGMDGVLVAHRVARAKDPREALLSLLEDFNGDEG